jgi:glucose-1-phosphate adenylyltransferase
MPTPVEPRGYLGTADAMYQHLSLLERINPTHVLILGSDHVYQMDYRHLLQFHQARRADVTIATFPVPRHQSSQFGIVTVDPLGEVTSFLEKPKPESPLLIRAPAVLASMGIYLFHGTMVPPGARIGCDLAADGEEFTVSDGGITVVGYATRARALASL